MDGVIDLSSLREITGGDRALEVELFAVFIESTSECFVALRVAFDNEDHIAWREAAHALKGASGSMGANTLYEICREAQNEFQADLEAKQALLADIEKELERIRVKLQAFA